MYPKAKREEADGVAWVFTDAKSDLVQYPFKFFDPEPCDVRLKVLHTALCQSDCLHARGQWGKKISIQVKYHTLAALDTKLWGKLQWLEVKLPH